MANAQEVHTGEFLPGRGCKRLFDEVCAGIFRELSQCKHAEGKELLAEVREILDREVAAEQRFRQEFGAALEEISRAGTTAELARLHKGLNGLVTAHFVRRDSAPAVHSLCTTVLDSIIGRALRLAEEELAENGFGTPPRYAWLVLGPAGRREATLSSELESLLVHEPGADAAGYCAELAGRAVAILEQSGYRKSGNGIMPDAPPWRASLDGWRERLEVLCRRSSEPQHPPLPVLPGLRLDEFFPLRKTDLDTPLFELADLRVASGDDLLGLELLKLVRVAAERHPVCIAEAAHSVASMPSPFTFLGNFRVERGGRFRGKLNLTRWACLPLVTMVRFQAVSGGITETGTLERIRVLMRQGALDVELGKRLLQGGLEIFRLMVLLEVQENSGQGDGVYLLPDSLTLSVEVALREALEAVTNLQKVIHSSMAEKV
jgi:CBS domain-containing protein